MTRLFSRANRSNAGAAAILAGVAAAAVHCAHQATKGLRIGDCGLFNQKQKPAVVEAPAPVRVSSPSAKAME